ncbi:hypothetical protein B0W47_00705 [Komagataeibacter nataicola]|uniref:Uncharacterized protein n=1 Tax=Komagataeibacter nataicola TaxID=265960 RepID=A0A9N7GZ02_9PROT|nr:hypothetical protein [Komagataeibacter nataicola]AQU86219.1 hypothetical protein B0W47_00705 [Komagataeibacter nataicola]PYD65353.1 hypothetical protein CDI09_14210 [Komagataeibacter nataicola]WNM08376.1 hypothetical protein RI056_16185 [Komagataeibacter nataicola]GBR23140.1 hypothetical protein AA0616_2453 [Komagataeibacter nataicola NRIC 0616]
MADIVSISRAIGRQMAAIVYIDGKGGGSVTGRPTKIRRGWLTQADYEGDECELNRGVDFITVMDLQGGWRRIDEPLGRPWRQEATIPATVSITTNGSTATIALQDGATPTGIVGLRIRSNGAAIPDRSVAAYVVQPTDTVARIAAALADQIDGATSSGAIVSVPGATTLEGAVGAYAPAVRTARRQQQLFQVTVWSASTEARDALGTALDNGMAFIDWLTDANGSTFQIESRGSWNNDAAQNSGIFMRPFRFIVTYDTDMRENMVQMLFSAGVMALPGGATHTAGDGALNGAA